MKIRNYAILLLVCILTASITYAETSTERTKYDGDYISIKDSFETVYTTGQYKCGFDIDAGEYVILSMESDGAYFSVTSDANGNDILFNDFFYVNAIVTVQAGEYIDLDNCLAIPSEEFYAAYCIDQGSKGTMLKVGAEYDILPGEYKLSAVEDDAYYVIYNSSILDHIKNNGIFDNSTYITIKEGEYLKLDDCFVASGVPTITPSPEPTSVPTVEPTVEPTPEPELGNKEEVTSEEPERPSLVTAEPKEEPVIVYEELKKGDKGEKVKVLQSKLISRGYLSGSADGNFGGMTESAIKEFQMANGLEITGIADNAMQQILFKVESVELGNMVFRVGSQGEEVKLAQTRLIELNYLKGSADGRFGNMTATAVKDYQANAGLSVTGEIDTNTMNSMMADDAPIALAYESLNYKEISRNSSNYEGIHYKFNGVIGWVTENVNGTTDYTTVTMGVNTKGRYDDDVYIEYDREQGEPRYLEGDKVVICGKYIGLYSYTTINNELRTIPRFELERIELR